MASIADRWHVVKRGSRTRERSARYGSGKRWQVRYRDPAGESRNRSFERKTDAERFLTEVSNQLLRGAYVDARDGRTPFGEYASLWLERQAYSTPSHVAVEVRLRVHISAEWGTTALADIRSSAIQSWIGRLQTRLAPSYVRLIVTNFSSVLGAAVEDGFIIQNPCKSRAVRLPKVQPKRLRPWTADQVLDVIDAHPRKLRALATVAAGCGLRQGEAFGVRVQDIDFDRNELHVRQQIRLEAGIPKPALPKYGRTRTVPLPEWVAGVLSAHMKDWRPFPGEALAAPSAAGLLFVSREKKPLNKNYFNPSVWRPAIVAAGIPRERENGMHALRHACASMWLEHGVSIKAVSEYLGHADPGFTLRVYTHVMPSSGEKARRAMDAAFGVGRSPSESASVAGAPSAHESMPNGGN